MGSRPEDNKNVTDWTVFVDPDTDEHYYSSKSKKALVHNIPVGIKASAFDWSKEMSMLLKEACDDLELAAICHRWETDKFMFWARDWEEKKIQRVIREWDTNKIAEIFQHRLLKKS
eukprot:g2537.t1